MKVLFFTIFVCLLSPWALSRELPLLYGKVNLEYVSVDQKPHFARVSNVGIKNVSNSESRIGVKGEYSLFSDNNIGYVLELGLDSTYKDDENSSTSGRIRIRKLAATYKNDLGKLTFGQTYTPTSEMVSKYDPLNSTSVGFQNGSQKLLVANFSNGAIGALYRSRRDLVRYTSPRLSGFQFDFSVDRNDKSENDPNSSGKGKTFYEGRLNYFGEASKFNYTADLAFISWGGEGKGLISKSTKDESSFFTGVKLEHESGNGVRFLYNITQYTDVSNSVDDVHTEKRAAVVLLRKVTDRHLLAITYARNEQMYNGRDGSLETMSDEDKFADSQLAFGYRFFASKKVEFKIGYALLLHEEKSNALEARSNEAEIISFGTQLKF